MSRSDAAFDAAAFAFGWLRQFILLSLFSGYFSLIAAAIFRGLPDASHFRFHCTASALPLAVFADHAAHGFHFTPIALLFRRYIFADTADGRFFAAIDFQRFISFSPLAPLFAAA